MSAYEDLSDWLLELAGIKSSVLEKHHTTLLNMAKMIHELGAPLEVEELVVEEVALSAGTCSKGKSCKSKVVEEPEEEEYYAHPYLWVWESCLYRETHRYCAGWVLGPQTWTASNENKNKCQSL